MNRSVTNARAPAKNPLSPRSQPASAKPAGLGRRLALLANRRARAPNRRARAPNRQPQAPNRQPQAPNRQPQAPNRQPQAPNRRPPAPQRPKKHRPARRAANQPPAAERTLDLNSRFTSVVRQSSPITREFADLQRSLREWTASLTGRSSLHNVHNLAVGKPLCCQP